MTINKDVLTNNLLWQKQRDQEARTLNRQCVIKLFEDGIRIEQEPEIRQFARNISYISLLFYLAGMASLAAITLVL